MDKSSKIYIAGHNGMVGSALVRKLQSEGYHNLVFSPYPPFDLTNQQIVSEFFLKKKPEYVFLAAAKVGGILSNNTFRAQFIYENLMIQNNIIHQSYKNGVKKLLFLGSSCIYPKNCPQPIKEEYLLTGELEYTNEPYAIAKIAGIKICESYNLQYGTNFISVMPTNLYGPNDNYDLETSHVLPALIRKMHLGKCLENNDWISIRKDLKKYPITEIDDASSESSILEVFAKYGIRKQLGNPKSGTRTSITITLWGTGSPYREFLHVDDLAVACLFVMKNIEYNYLKQREPELKSDFRNFHLNIGTGQDLRISNLADFVKEIVGFKGEISWDTERPDGTPRKLLDVTKINSLGWVDKINMKTGLAMVYENYIAQ
jgi:GDP-L-fucose synthase